MSKPWRIGLGCLGTFLFSGLILLLVMVFIVLPKMVPWRDSNVVLLTELGIRRFMIDYPQQVPETGDNKVWAALLADRKMAGMDMTFSQITVRGEFVSLLRVPLEIETVGSGVVRVVSAGVDREMNTDDDIDSERAQEILEQIEAKALKDQAD